MFLSIVIPAYNEGKRLPQTLDEIRPYLESKGQTYEVLISDDGSSDNTVALCEQKAAGWPELRCLHGYGHHGKGATVKRGALAARGDYVLVMDADHATPVDTLDFFLPLISDYDMVVGVRTFCGEEGASGRFRRIVGLIQQLMAHLIVFQKSVADSQCGFKLFTQKSAQQLFSRSLIQGGMFDVELFFIAHKHKLKIFSKPVKWVNKAGSTIDIARCMLVDPLQLIYIRILDFLGSYN